MSAIEPEKCRRGHALTPDNVTPGGRCRGCNREYAQAFHNRNRYTKDHEIAALRKRIEARDELIAQLRAENDRLRGNGDYVIRLRSAA